MERELEKWRYRIREWRCGESESENGESGKWRERRIRVGVNEKVGNGEKGESEMEKWRKWEMERNDNQNWRN
jgi:hypothetical protein